MSRRVVRVGALKGFFGADPDAASPRALLAQAASEALRFSTSDRLLVGLGHGWIDDATS